MTPSGEEIRDAREAVERLLTDLRLRSFLYTLEPREGPWHLHIECAEDGEWQSFSAPMDPASLRASLHDRVVRDRLRDMLDAKLRNCPRSADST
jgi:hypothetical protein